MNLKEKLINFKKNVLNNESVICKTVYVASIEELKSIENIPDIDLRVVITNDLDFNKYDYLETEELKGYFETRIAFKPIDLKHRTHPIIISGGKYNIKNINFLENDEIKLFKNDENCQIIISNLNFVNVDFVKTDTKRVDVDKIKAKKLD